MRKVDGWWVHPDTGTRIPNDEVSVDEQGYGWHTVTAYQRDVLQALLTDLRHCLVALPPGTEVKPNGSYRGNRVEWADLSGYIVGHATLDPYNKTDPGPFVCEWLRRQGWAL